MANVMTVGSTAIVAGNIISASDFAVSTVDSVGANLTVPGNLTVQTKTNFGAVGNLTITGGTSGQVLSTDGSGVLSWITAASAPTITTPSITSPTASQTNFPPSGPITASGFSASSGLHTSSDWQIATDGAFTTVVAGSAGNTTALTSWSVSGLSALTAYYVRVRYTSSLKQTSAWSPGVSFTTGTNASLIPTAQSISATAGTAITPTTTYMAMGFIGTVTYSISPALPSAMSLNTTNGVISGTPAATQSATSYVLSGTGSTSGFATSAITITVAAAAPTITPATQTVSGTSGTAITATTAFTATGFVGAVTYTVSPSLPSGLSIDTNTGVISGTPAVFQASTSYTVTGTGATSGTATATVDITVAKGAVSIDYLVLAGGGGARISGGGAGGYLSSTASLTAGSYPIVVGAGGAGGATGANGTNSTFNGLTAIGGGGGVASGTAGKLGGSGSGGAAAANGGSRAGGAGTAGQGFAGSTATSSLTQVAYGGGGGAGAAAPAATSNLTTAAAPLGGIGKTWVDTVQRGGGGSAYFNTGSAGYGGGTGATGAAAGGAGGTNKGGGGGGGNAGGGGAGGSGVVIVRYAGTVAVMSGGTITTSGGFVYHTFNASGTLDY